MIRPRRNKGPDVTPEEREEAVQAVVNAEEEEQKVQESKSEIIEIVGALREYRKRNNFASVLRQALGGAGR